MSNQNIQMEASWKDVLVDEFSQPYFIKINEFIKTEKEAGKDIYPPEPLIFKAFNATPFENVRVIILGQDPYHGNGQAHGLSFSVPIGVKPPPSLMNIFKELKNEFPDFEIPKHGNLEKWAAQGVFLINAMLTVEANMPASHQKIGWQEFTNAVIKKLSKERQGLIFLLWGNFAQQKAVLIDETKHTVLKTTHPSPFSAYNGFLGCNHFYKVNEILKEKGEKEIDWQI